MFRGCGGQDERGHREAARHAKAQGAWDHVALCPQVWKIRHGRHELHNLAEDAISAPTGVVVDGVVYQRGNGTLSNSWSFGQERSLPSSLCLLGLQSLTFTWTCRLVPFTISAGILSKAVSARHQGMVAGVIGGVRAQAYGLGPVIYASIFRVFTQTGSNLPYLPGASYLFSAVMMALCSLLALFLDSAGRIVVASDDDL
mmetsp:Transcript_14597/g.41660  ORF Transcript_14597/g.41660 Transcript_14597/m.41660 type:complete len:200 (+) Transcript_14597:522-1121(+)